MNNRIISMVIMLCGLICNPQLVFSAPAQAAGNNANVGVALTTIMTSGTTNVTNGTITAHGPGNDRSFTPGSHVKLTATPNVGYVFIGWSGTCSVRIANDGTCNAQAGANGAVTVAANFAPAFQLTTTATHGTITANPPASIGYPFGAYAPGTQVTLTATPNAGYLFTGWTGCTGTANSCTGTMNSNVSVAASFVPSATLTIANASNGTITASPTSSPGYPPGSYAPGTQVSLTAKPNAHFVLAGWSGACSGTSNPCILTMPASNTSVTADFYVSAFGLTWMPATSKPYTYAQAAALCAGTIAGRTGWRLPTSQELHMLTYDNNHIPLGLSNKGWTLVPTWTSDPSSCQVSSNCTTPAHWVVVTSLPDYGLELATPDNAEPVAVTCVR